METDVTNGNRSEEKNKNADERSGNQTIDLSVTLSVLHCDWLTCPQVHLGGGLSDDQLAGGGGAGRTGGRA